MGLGGKAGGRGGTRGFCFSAHCLSSDTFFHPKPECSLWDGWFPPPCIVMVCPGCVGRGPCQLAQLLNSQNPYFKVITDQKSRLSHTAHNYFQIPSLGSPRKCSQDSFGIEGEWPNMSPVEVRLGAVQGPLGLRQGIGVIPPSGQLLAGLGPGLVYAGLSGSSLSLGMMVPVVHSSQKSQQKFGA